MLHRLIYQVDGTVKIMYSTLLNFSNKFQLKNLNIFKSVSTGVASTESVKLFHCSSTKKTTYSIHA